MTTSSCVLCGSYENTTEKGTTWTVFSPIIFTYQVTETQDLLDPANNTLLLGHITDTQQLESVRSQTLCGHWPRSSQNLWCQADWIYGGQQCPVQDHPLHQGPNSHVDASVGAKTGVKFGNCKNKLCAYIPSVAAFLDLILIQTVPRRHISCWQRC